MIFQIVFIVWSCSFILFIWDILLFFHIPIKNLNLIALWKGALTLLCYYIIIVSAA